MIFLENSDATSSQTNQQQTTLSVTTPLDTTTLETLFETTKLETTTLKQAKYTTTTLELTTITPSMEGNNSHGKKIQIHIFIPKFTHPPLHRGRKGIFNSFSKMIFKESVYKDKNSQKI